MRYRKKSVIIEAWQWNNKTSDGPMPYWLVKKAMGDTTEPGVLIIPTLEGQMRASVGDWIICGIHGEIYPCKPDIFEATYEVVEAVVQGWGNC